SAGLPPGARKLSDRGRAAQTSGRNENTTMINDGNIPRPPELLGDLDRRKPGRAPLIPRRGPWPGSQLGGRRTSCLVSWIVMVASISIGIGCGTESAGASGTSSRSSADRAALFSIPADQMAHIQIVTVTPSTLTRSLRLTGAVAFNGFATTPVITQ